MRRKEHTKTEEKVETVAQESSVEEKASTESTVSTNSDTNLSATGRGLDHWWPEEVDSHQEIVEHITILIQKFFPKRPLLSFTSWQLEKAGAPKEKARTMASDLIDSALLRMKSGVVDKDWNKKLSTIFENQYPSTEREVWVNGRLCQKRYPRRPPEMEYPPTFRFATFDPISNPKNALCSRIAPALFEIDSDSKGEDKLVKTAEAERFLNGEKDAVPKSSLHELMVFNRPVYGLSTGWLKYDATQLPQKIVTAKLLGKNKDSSLMRSFIEDLRETFAWEADNYLANYMGYIIQPMISHLCVGQMPAYGFFGPTKSGKGYLSNALPSVIYSRLGDPTVYIKKIPNSTYEMEVFLSACREALYLCFDEVKNASDEELKLIDAFCTQKSLQLRKIRQGYQELENLFTLSMTAVHRTFSDETNGRLALIKLKQSRSELIAEFHTRWRGKGAAVLKEFKSAIDKVPFDFKSIERVSDRRPGFSVVSHFLKNAFDLNGNFEVESASNEVLDDLCKMFEEAKDLGDQKGKWKRYSPANFVNFMSQKYERRWKKTTASSAINTALGYSSTKFHPNYKDGGYPAESGVHYHIEVREEGQKSRRTFIYIQPVSQD